MSAKTVQPDVLVEAILNLLKDSWLTDKTIRAKLAKQGLNAHLKEIKPITRDIFAYYAQHLKIFQLAPHHN